MNIVPLCNILTSNDYGLVGSGVRLGWEGLGIAGEENSTAQLSECLLTTERGGSKLQPLEPVNLHSQSLGVILSQHN